MNKAKPRKEEVVFQAAKIVPGLAIGPAFPFRRRSFELDDFDYAIGDTDHEMNVFDNACIDAVNQINQTEKLGNSENIRILQAMLDSQVALLQDRELRDEIRDVISTKKRPASYAVISVLSSKKDHFFNLDNEYFRDRAFDIIELKNRLIHTISGITTDFHIGFPSIVFAEVLSPSDTIHFDRKSLLGFVTDTGGRTSHAAIMANSLNLPYMVNDFGLSKLINIQDQIILDGFNGKIFVNPAPETIEEYTKLQKKYNRNYLKLIRESALPATTLDGEEITVMANAELISELEQVKMVGAQGIGLLRTEGLFIEKEKIPDEEEQYQMYTKFADGLENLPLIIRTLDAGGDKILPGMQGTEEQNPFLGWRAIRFCLDEPEIFKAQLRAILRANVSGNISILLPMITSISEIKRTRQLITESAEELAGRGKPVFHMPKLGIMIETPSAAILANSLAPEVDFFSIGTNDLTQYTLAVDRTNSMISSLFDDLHPAVLHLISSIIAIGKRHKIEVSVCGEMAGSPGPVALLIGMGLNILSISGGQIPMIKNFIRQINMADCRQLAKDVMAKCETEDIDPLLAEFVNKNFTDWQ